VADNGFVMVSRDMLYAPRLSAHARFVWIVLQSHANEAGECWPSQERLAELTGLSKPTIRHCLDCLIAAGAIERRRSAHANHYRVQRKVSSPCEEVQEQVSSPCTGKNLSPEGGQRKESYPCEDEQRKESFLPGEKNLPLQRKDSFPERDSENENHRTRLILSPPEELGAFDRILRRAPGYEPSAEFYEKVVERYRTVDLSEEALKLVGWLGEPPQRKKGRTANTATIFNWLKRATTDRPQEYRNGTHRNGTRSVDTVDALAKYDG
jgi:hypothetical protein